MKFIIDQSPEYCEPEITIKCDIIDPRLQQVISQIRLYSFTVLGKKEGQTVSLSLQDIFYFESVDDKTFIYTRNDVFTTDLRLYELENQLVESRFVRISKAIILNIGQLHSVRAMLNSRYEATMKNGEKIIITRHYLADFKQKFEIGGE